MKREETYSLADVRRAIESGVRAGLAEALRSLGAQQQRTARRASAEAVRDWIAKRIGEHVARAGKGGQRDLARAVGVSEPTISRWRLGLFHAATEHLPALLRALGSSEEEMAAELDMESLPTIHARNPAGSKPKTR